MKSLFASFPLALKMILKDPINLFLVLFPTVIALALYGMAVSAIFHNSDIIAVSLRDYVHSPETAGLLGKFLTAMLIIFVFVLMSWTFVIVVGIIAAPFNSMISARIEKRLVGKVVEQDRKKTVKEMIGNLGQTFKNEAKKLFFIVFLSFVAFILNLFPVLYPLGFFLISILMAAQFIDYSWSRHEMKLGTCVGDLLKNIIPYGLSGFLFLLLITVPIINAFVPALATSYFTVLWLHRQNKISLQ